MKVHIDEDAPKKGDDMIFEAMTGVIVTRTAFNKPWVE